MSQGSSIHKFSVTKTLLACAALACATAAAAAIRNAGTGTLSTGPAYSQGAALPGDQARPVAAPARVETAGQPRAAAVDDNDRAMHSSMLRAMRDPAPDAPGTLRPLDAHERVDRAATLQPLAVTDDDDERAMHSRMLRAAREPAPDAPNGFRSFGRYERPVSPAMYGALDPALDAHERSVYPAVRGDPYRPLDAHERAAQSAVTLSGIEFGPVPDVNPGSNEPRGLDAIERRLMNNVPLP